MISEAATVKEYLEDLPPDRRTALGQLCSLIRRVAPNEDEAMKYGMPAFGDLCAFASQKNYLALYVCEGDILKNYKAKLGRVDCGKCCIRFKGLNDPNLDVVESILEEILKLRKQGISQGSC